MTNFISKIHSFILRKPLLILFSLWVLVQVCLLYNFGIVTTKEATKYSEEAHNLLYSGHFSEPKYIFYSVYIFLHIIFYKLGFETTGVYTVQLLTNLFAMFLFYKTAFRVSKKRTVAFISVFLLLICYTWQYWTVFLYTESFFCSLIVIFTYFLFGVNVKNTLHELLVLILFILLLFARPTGMLFIPVACCLLMYKLLNKRKFVTALCIGAVSFLLFISILSYAMKGGASYDFMKPLVENNVLCYIPEAPVKKSVNKQNEGSGIESVGTYIFHNPLRFARLSCLKFISYWGFTRPYYSQLHNLWLMCFFYPLYVFASIGIWKIKKKYKYFIFYTVMVLTVFTLSVMVTCDDWSNRFTVPIIPFIILLASVGIIDVYEKVVAKMKIKT